MKSANIFKNVREHHSKISLTLLSGILNFIFQIYVARRLAVSDYGKFFAVWTGVAVVSLFTVGFQNHATVQTIQNLHEQKNQIPIKISYIRSVMQASIILLLASTILLLISPITNVTKWQISIIMWSLPISIFSSIVLGRSLGSKKPTEFYKQNNYFSAVKLLSALVYLYMFNNVLELIVWLLLTHFLLTFYWYRRQNKVLPKIWGHFWNIDSRRILIVSSVYWSMVGLDVILFRFQSDENFSGLYSAASTIAKIPLILFISVSAYLLHKNNSKSLNSVNTSLDFAKAGALCLALILVSAICAGIFNNELMQFTLGTKYISGNLILKQILAYSGLMFFGLTLSFRYHNLQTRDTVLIVLFGIGEFIYLTLNKLQLNIFLFTIWLLPTIMSVILASNFLNLRKFVIEPKYKRLNFSWKTIKSKLKDKLFNVI